jgi:hypothetical protein
MTSIVKRILMAGGLGTTLMTGTAWSQVVVRPVIVVRPGVPMVAYRPVYPAPYWVRREEWRERERAYERREAWRRHEWREHHGWDRY